MKFAWLLFRQETQFLHPLAVAYWTYKIITESSLLSVQWYGHCISPRLSSMAGSRVIIYYKHFINLVHLLKLCLKYKLLMAKVTEIEDGFIQWVNEYEC